MIIMDNMEKFFSPDSIAVIGASRKTGKVGNSVVKNLKDSFDGKVYPVNPKADRVAGLRCYDSIEDIEETPESAVIAVPAKIANMVMEQCVELGVPAVTMLTSGYGETGEEGEKLQEELEEIIEGSDTRMIGPNCLGIWDSSSGMDSMFLPGYKMEEPEKGNIAVISQSGAVGSALLDLAADQKIGVSKFVSYGNQLDVSETDLLEYLGQDENTDAVAVYMEGVKDGQEFLEKAGKVTEDTPVVILKAGKTEEGSEAAVSHTGSMAGNYQVYQGAFRQKGIIEAVNTRQLFDYAKTLAKEEKPGGDRVAVVTNGGGFGVLATDAVSETGLELAEFSEETREKLEDVVKDYGNVSNPLDLVGDAEPELYQRSLDILSEASEVDMVLCISLVTLAPIDPSINEIIEDVHRNSEKPVVGCMMGGSYTKMHTDYLEEKGVPMFRRPEDGVKALEALRKYHDIK